MRYWSRSMSHPPSRVRQIVRESSPLASAFADQIPFQTLPETEEISPTEKSILDRLEQIISTPEVVPVDETPGGIGSLDSIARLAAETAELAEELERTRIDDHGNLVGLADDDHTQYHTNTRGDARYYTKTQLMISGILDWVNFGRYLGVGNTRAFTPDQDYEPATKKYVDDNVLVEGEIDHTALLNIGTNSHADIDTHIADTSDPHGTEMTVTTKVLTPEVKSTGIAFTLDVPRAGAASSLMIENSFGPDVDVNIEGSLTISGTLEVVGAVTLLDPLVFEENPGYVKGTHGNMVFQIYDNTSAVNYLRITNSITTAAPILEARGSDTDIDLELTPKGAGKLNLDGIKWPNADGTADQILKTDGSGVLSWADLGAPGPHDHDGDTLKHAEWENPGGATYLRIDVQHSRSSGVLITNDGAGSNAHLLVNGSIKGAYFTMGANNKIVDSQNSELLTTAAADAAAVNNVHIAHAQTGNAPELSAVGSDTDVDLKVTPKGAGKVNLDGIKWPNVDGSPDQILKTDGSGTLSWTALGTPSAHKDSHDPEDGSDALDCAAAVDIGTGNTEGTAHSFARSDHIHKIPDKWRTRSFLVEVPTPADDDEFIVHLFPYTSTLTEVRVHVEAATSVTFELTERGYDTPDAGGTDISAAAITATTTPANVNMNNNSMAPNSVLVYHSSAVVGTPGKVWIFGKYTVD